MTIELTKKLKNKKNTFKWFVIKNDLNVFYVCTINNIINTIRQRVYEDKSNNEIVSELFINNLPKNVNNYFLKFNI